MPHSIRIARLIEKQRGDGSRYLIGDWQGLRIIANAGETTEGGQPAWELRLSCLRADELAARAARHTARAYRLTGQQQAAYDAGEWKQGQRFGKRARLESTIADALEVGEMDDD